MKEKERSNIQKEKNTKLNRKKIVIYVILLLIVMYILYTIYLLIMQPTNIFTIEEGKLYQEETDIGYVIRNEKVVKGENYKNGMKKYLDIIVQMRKI